MVNSVKQAYSRLRLKFMPFLDSFQACFKDKYRFFAGLYFTYRIAIALFSFQRDSVYMLYCC